MMTTTCEVCGYVLSEPAPDHPCPQCGGPMRTDVVVPVPAARAHAAAGTVSLTIINRYAEAWYEDALHEAREGRDHHARRREILFAVCCAESYIYEWTYDLLDTLTGQPLFHIDQYFPPEPQPGWKRRVVDQWKEVPKLLHNQARIAATPDLSGEDWKAWDRLADYRNGLVHAHVSRPDRGPADTPAWQVTTRELAALPAGWATNVVAERIRRLHEAAQIPVPRWLATP